MFPHTITVINVVDKKFYSQIVSNVFYLEERIIANEGLGEKYQNVHRCIFSNTALEDYVEIGDYKPDSGVFTLKENDIIVKGEITDIASLNDLQTGNYKWFQIKSIADHHDYGDEYLRNIDVTD